MSKKLSKEDLIDVAKLIVNSGGVSQMYECATGLQVDLDKLNNDNLIINIFHQINHKLQK